MWLAGRPPVIIIPEENAFYTGFKFQGQPIAYAFNQRLKWEWFLSDIPGRDRSVLFEGPHGSNSHQLIDPLMLEIELRDSDAQMLSGRSRFNFKKIDRITDWIHHSIPSDAADEPDFVEGGQFFTTVHRRFQDQTGLEIFVETRADQKWEVHNDGEYAIREGPLGSIPNEVVGRRLRYIQASEYSED
ncbi:hypothetical protein E1B28_006794 [Marasmius oreades]|uniref:Uncharacterized protein n=1 Tax=Marasmius oreades TaxID=181124 RepID=A0A9P8ABH1_9AGAR|nr:uncharacterized protein E1B28_006794 [Marasmius oreades]KAG7096120.1 hypothetical protein E1B28_006794 [Marasmius oreades]